MPENKTETNNTFKYFKHNMKYRSYLLIAVISGCLRPAPGINKPVDLTEQKKHSRK